VQKKYCYWVMHKNAKYQNTKCRTSEQKCCNICSNTEMYCNEYSNNSNSFILTMLIGRINSKNSWMDSCEIFGIGNPSDTFNSIRSVLLMWVRCALYKGLQPDERSQKFHCFESYSIVLWFLFIQLQIY